MIPLWNLSLLNTMNVGEFLYDNGCRIHIDGVLVNNEWEVNIRVNAEPYFLWGCNGLHTGIRGSFNSVVGYYLAIVVNQLSEYNAKERDGVYSVMRGYLE